MDGKLVANFPWEKFFTEVATNDPVSFEELYDVLGKWAISPENQTLGYDDFAAAEIKDGPVDSTEAFKKKTDKLI